MNHRIAQPAVGSITAGTAGRSAAPNPWLPWLGTPRYRCARPRWPWFRRPDRFWRYRRGRFTGNLHIAAAQLLAGHGTGQIVILTLRIIRLRPLRHFQGDILTVLARGIRQRVLLDRGSAAPRSAGIGLVRAKFNTESGMAFNSSLASSGNATASMDGVVGSEASCDAPCEVVVPEWTLHRPCSEPSRAR